MRRILFVIAVSLFSLSSVMGQMIPVNLPADGNWPTIVGDSIMIIGPRQNELTEEQRYFNPVYLMVYPGKEHLTAQIIRAGLCDCDLTKPNRRIGVFSVAPNKKVSFSQGNLQYLPAINLWKFANTQYESLGNANKYLKPKFRNWVDLFGWSANNTTAPFGVSTSTNVADYAGDFVDWGTNTICGDAPGTWRTLSADEWEYLFEQRKNALQLRSKGSINGHRGHILLPDDWVLPEGVQFVAEPDNLTMELDINTYTPAEWSIMEEAGAVFLPAAGRRDGTTIGYLVEYSGVWSSTSTTNTNAFHTYYNYDSQIIEHHWTSATSRINGRSVRLVHDTIVLEAEPEYVDLGLSVKWATFNVGATSPEDYGDYFAWGETETKDKYSWATYKWCDGTSTNMTKYNSTDGKTILEPADDAAQVHWGGKWRMPSKEEVDELTQQCNWIWTTHNNVNGYKVTGPNGNSIFLPAAGYKGAGPTYPAGEDGLYWTNTTELKNYSYLIGLHDDAPPTQAGRRGTRCYGFAIRPVYDDRVTLTVIPTPEDAKVSFHCSGYQWAGNSITVDKGKDVLYQVTNVDAGYLSQGDSIYNLTKDSVLYVTLRPFSDGNWVVVDNSEYTKQEGYYVSRNKGAFASYSVWNYYVLPVLPGETYRVRSIAGQHAALWMAASTAPNPATNTRPTKISCCANRGVAAYVADEVTIPDGAKYLIINSRNGKEMMVERKVPEPCMVVKVNDTLSINLMCVEGGTFTMGDNNTSIASPAHQVTLSDYYIGETEVTQALWKSVMGNIPTGNKNPSYPVGYVTYADCQNFIAKLNNLTGLHFQLPTEAEWEYAAMGGNKSHNYIYSGSNTIDDVAWYDQNSENKMHNVGAKQPNELGIYDMSGNAWEWCADYYDKYTADPKNDTKGPTTGTGRVIRSGSFRTTAERCSNKHRQAREADYPDSHITFRLVLHDTEPAPEPEYVDLGLSVKWATFNVGATSPEDYGDYFAWGETEPKETYSWATYKWCDGTSSNITKYNSADGKTILEPADDAAQVHWGGKWRMPSKEEVDELTQQCNWIWTTHNNVNGYKVTGPNGNSIFLPAAGYKGAGPTYPAGEDGLYWTNTTEKGPYSYLIVLHNDAPPTQAGRQGTRCFGFTIRPVYDDIPDPCLVVKVNDTISINLMCVEGGTFMMGSDAGDAEADEQPVHEVTLSDYYIGQTEVTQKLWKLVMDNNNPSANKGDELPVTNITWDEAQVFVQKLSEMTGLHFRLPTEAEWEYAARGGQNSKGYTYAGSNDIDKVGWYNGNSSNKMHAVGQKQPNELGIYDMTGNVWEYCSDWHMPYSAQAQTNPTGAVTGEKHVLRGGCYHYDSKNCTNTNRHSYYTPDKGGASTGLRIVLES